MTAQLTRQRPGRFGRARHVVSQHGLRESVHLANASIVLPAVMRAYPTYAKARGRLAVAADRHGVASQLAQLRDHREEILAQGEKGYRRPPSALGLSSAAVDMIQRHDREGIETLIAHIDQDGYLLSEVGEIANAPTVDKTAFQARRRFDVRIVVHAGTLAVRKSFGDDQAAFVRELRAAHALSLAGCSVPAVLDIDFDSLTLTLSYIVGPVLRERLSEMGARMHDRKTPAGSAGIGPADRVADGRRLVPGVLTPEMIDDLAGQLRMAHRAGFVLNDVKYGNVVLDAESGRPYLIDFDGASDYAGVSGLTHRFLRDADNRRFNEHFGTGLLTDDSVRRLTKRGASGHRRFYAPVYVDGGLRFGSIWGTGSGYGRWRYILRDNLPALPGARVLDLGANNGFNSIQMLRAGAREVVAFELQDTFVEHGDFVKRLFEWADNTNYSLRYVQDSMANVEAHDLGTFDIVTGLCSIYYLEDDEINRLVRYASTVAPCFVWQCNIDRTLDRPDSQTFQKASVEYAVNALQQNGYASVEVIAPPGYTRPIVIGRRGSSTSTLAVEGRK